jgi:hypothetical protein
MLFFFVRQQTSIFHGPQDCKQRTKRKFSNSQALALARGHKLFTNQFVYLKKSPFTAACAVYIRVYSGTAILSAKNLFPFLHSVFRPPRPGALCAHGGASDIQDL